MKPELRDRLAGLRIEIDEAVQSRHLDAVADELRDPRAAVRFRKAGRTRVATLIAAAIMLVLPAAAFAAEDAVPGDLLYPIKRATERVLLVVDPNIDAEHRIEELETVVDRAAPADEVAERLADAEEIVLDRDVPADLLARLDAVRDRVSVEAGDEGTRGDDVAEELGNDPSVTEGATTTIPPATTPTTTSPPPTTSSPAPSDRRESTTTTSTTEPPRTDRPGRDATTTTTAPPRDGDEPPSDRGG